MNTLAAADVQETLLAASIILALVGVFGGSAYLDLVASRKILRAWAQRTQLQIVAYRRCYFFTGPFFLRSSKAQQVYRVTVSDQSGQLRGAWVRCGNWWSGSFLDEISVRWDA